MDSNTQEKTSIEMEQNLSAMAKKFWGMVRVFYFILERGVSKGKLMMDLKFMMMKRNKLSGKPILNLRFHHNKVHNNWSSAFSSITSAGNHHKNPQFHAPPNEYEFSCSNSPAYPSLHLPFHLNKRKNSHHTSNPLSGGCYQPEKDDDLAMHAVIKTLEMLHSVPASPALPGFGKSPMVRQLRITDSPFPLRDVDEDSHIDEAAEEFIKKFYKDLRRQNAMSE